jgi:hypothetical protein
MGLRVHTIAVIRHYQPAKLPEDLTSLRRLLARRRHTAARVRLSAAELIALLKRLPADAAVYVSVGDLNTLVAAGDERRAE